MKSLVRLVSVLVIGLVSLSGAVSAQETGTLSLNLAAVTYPDNRWVDITFTGTGMATTGAELKGRARGSGGQTRIELEWKNMQPAALFGGNVAAYAVFAITPEGTIENLGELPVRQGNGDAKYQTGRKRFALVVAADVTATLPRPSELVVAFSNPATPSEAPSTTFTSSDFRKAPVHEKKALGAEKWTDKTPIELVQAERAMTAAKAYGATEGNATAMTQAETALAQARNLAGSGGDKKAMADSSRKAVALATTATLDTARMRAEKAAAEAEAARKAEAAALESAAKSASERAASSAQQAALMEAKARDLEAQRQALLADQATLEAERQALIVDRDRIKSERDALAETLATALATVAAVRETAAGTIVDLPGILFDTGKATLKPGAQITIAKLSGILMMFPLSTLDIRGHTDSTGSMELNMRLSKERAQAVYDFLASQGLPKERMKFDGSGPNEPIASNDTADGRAKNRRVEVLIIEGGALEAGAAN